MSQLERFLFVSTLFLLVIRIAVFTDDVPTLENNPDAVRSGERGDFNTPSGVMGAPENRADNDAAGGADDVAQTFDWHPASFTRRGIPKKLTLAPDGRIPETMQLSDTQKTFVYATMMETYDILLTRARDECPRDVRLDVTRWQARHARTIADAGKVLDVLAPNRDSERHAHAGIPAVIFAQRICPTIDHYLRTGAYDPHRKAVTRLAHAARSAKPE